MNIEKVILNASKADCTGCRTCATNYEADNLRHAVARLNGISKAKVDEITGKVTIEYETQKISLSKITGRIEKLGARASLAAFGILNPVLAVVLAEAGCISVVINSALLLLSKPKPLAKIKG